MTLSVSASSAPPVFPQVGQTSPSAPARATAGAAPGALPADAVDSVGASVLFDAPLPPRLWTVERTFPMGVTPAVDDAARVFVGNLEGEVVALDGTSGERLWEKRTGLLGGPPLVGPQGRVYVAPVSGPMAALDPADGHIIWNRPAADGKAHFVDPLKLAGDDVLVARSQDGRLFGIASGDGATLWEKACAPPVAIAPLATSSGSVVAGRPGYRGLDAYDAHTGAELWTQDVEGRITSLAEDDGVVYVAWNRKVEDKPASRTMPMVRAIRERTGEVVWESEVDAQPGFDDLYLSARDGKMVATTLYGRMISIDPATGSVGWKRELSNGQQLSISPPVVGPQGRVYVTEMSKSVLVFDAAAGTDLATYSIPSGSSKTAPAFLQDPAQESVYVVDDGGTLHGVRRDTPDAATLLARAAQREAAPPAEPPHHGGIEVSGDQVVIDGVSLPRRR